MRRVLILLAFLAGGAVPIQLVTLSFGYAQYIRQEDLGPKVIRTAHEFAAWYIPWVYGPALVVLILIVLGTYRRYPDICRRILGGLCAGAIATLALDAVRQAGVIHGWLPGDTPVMFGKMATGSNDFGVFYPVGLFVHYFNGANFGLFYAFVWGKQGSVWAAACWATVWSLIVELGMMLGPPMGPMVGLFGMRYAWPQLFLLTLVAHMAFGIALGLLAQALLKDEDRGGLLHFLQGQRAAMVS
ncbi:MAG: hypothetical protein OEU26_23635 [Candidatus Tectomicrobia bacterium]|nr:hypothetical protein [Candidatus Tectomicrobia bacterium]